MTQPTVDAFAERMFDAVLAAMDMWAIYLGEHLGYYEALATGPRTKDELAVATEPMPATHASGWSSRPSAGSSGSTIPDSPQNSAETRSRLPTQRSSPTGTA